MGHEITVHSLVFHQTERNDEGTGPAFGKVEPGEYPTNPNSKLVIVSNVNGTGTDDVWRLDSITTSEEHESIA